jgi:uncharacterized membrane protein HdeD (DUF308 family)
MESVTAPADRTINYVFLLGGVVALIFGIVLLFRQDEAIALLMVILGLWWLIQGAFMLFAVFLDRTDMWWKLIIGTLGVVAGFLVLTNPGEAADVFQGVIGVILGVIGLLVGVTSVRSGAEASVPLSSAPSASSSVSWFCSTPSSRPRS